MIFCFSKTIANISPFKLLEKYSVRLRADQNIWSRSNIWYRPSNIMDRHIGDAMDLDLSWNWRAVLASQLSRWTLWQLKELSCAAHHSPGFAVQLTNKVLQNSSNLHKNAIRDIGSYVSPRVTWRHHVHYYCLREARYLINHTFSDIHWSFHFFFFPDDLFSKASPWSVCLRLGMTTWSLGLRPQSHFISQSTVLDRTLMVFSLSAQSCASSLQLKSMSGQGSMTSPVTTSSPSLASFLMALTTWQWQCHRRLWQKCWTLFLPVFGQRRKNSSVCIIVNY